MSAAKRPFWIRDSAVQAGVYLGFTNGQWPIHAFSAEHSHHLDWAAEDPVNRVLIGPIQVPDDAPVLRGRKVPATSVLVDDAGIVVES